MGNYYNNLKHCNHDKLLYLGEQEVLNGDKPYASFNCVECKTTLNFKKEKINVPPNLQDILKEIPLIKKKE